MVSCVILVLAVLLTARSLAASTLNTTRTTNFVPSGAECTDYTITVPATSLNYPWNASKWTDNYGFIDFASALTSRVDDGFPPPFGAPMNETSLYNISGTICTPVKSGYNPAKFFLATHGLGFDRSYWNPSYKPDKYNFAKYAIDRGYSIFFYDRLGVGASSSISGFHNQLNIQVSVLSSLINFLHSAPVPPSPPTSIVLIGHSFGSFLINALLAIRPTLPISAAIMTGYGLVGSDDRLVLQGFAPRVANLQSPKFSQYDPGYITTADVISNINNFFKAPAYESDVAQYAENTKAPFAISELVSLTPKLLNLDASAYKGPAFVISGEYDWIVCGGYCPGEMDASFGPLFKGAKDFETYVQPGSGHSLNFAVNATGAFGVIFDYLGRNGL